MISIKVTSRHLVEALRAAAGRIRNTLPLMREITGIMHAEVEDNFEAQGRPKWEDLKPATKARRAKQGHWPGPMLQVEGRLVRSITPDAEETRATVGTNVEYAAAQHFGATITMYPRSSLFSQNRTTKGRFTPGRGKEIAGGKGKSTFGQRTIKIPARPFLVVTAAGLNKIISAVKRFFPGT